MFAKALVAVVAAVPLGTSGATANRASEPAVTRDVTEFGAICDGVSHPLSKLFADLRSAQAVFPRATSLRDEVDAVAIQKAIDMAVIGEEVVIPAGLQCRINVTLTVWKGITLRGTGTRHDRPAYEHHAQLRIVGSIAGIRFDETRTPDGKPQKAFAEQGARLVGLKFRGDSGDSAHGSIGVALRKFWLGEISDCHFNALGTGISVNGAWVVNIHDNEFTDVGFAVRADPSCVACGNTDGWYQVNALRFEHNDIQNAHYGVYLVSPGNSISVNENTIEACSRAGVLIATYAAAVGKDGAIGLRGVEVRGNYFEANKGASIQLGVASDDPLRQAASAPFDVAITQNQCNMDEPGPCVLLNAVDGAEIVGNSVRNFRAGQVDVVLGGSQAHDLPFLKRATIVAELGYSGPVSCGSECSRVTVRPRDPARVRRDFNVVMVSANDPHAARSRSAAREMLAGTPGRPLASAALLADYVEQHRDAIDSGRAIRVEFAPGTYPLVRLAGFKIALELSFPEFSGEVRLEGLSISDVQRLSIRASPSTFVVPTESSGAAPIKISNATVEIHDLRFRYPAGGGAAGSVALEAGVGAAVILDGLDFSGSGRPDSAIRLSGGSVVLLGSGRPSAGRRSVVSPDSSAGELVRQRADRLRSTPPSGGPFDTGEVVWNAAVVEGQPAGWICSARPVCSAPAEWRSFGPVR